MNRTPRWARDGGHGPAPTNPPPHDTGGWPVGARLGGLLGAVFLAGAALGGILGAVIMAGSGCVR